MNVTYIDPAEGAQFTSDIDQMKSSLPNRIGLQFNSVYTVKEPTERMID